MKTGLIYGICPSVGLALVATLAQPAWGFTNMPVEQVNFLSSNPDYGDTFSQAVAVSGNTMVVGAIAEDSNAVGVNGDPTDNSRENSGAAYVYVFAGSNWVQQAYLKASNPDNGDGFGNAVGISGDTIVVSAPGEASNAKGINGAQTNNSAFAAGAAYVFVRSGTNWTQQAYLKASNTEEYDGFGTSAAISGDTIVVGAPSESSNATGVNGNQTNNLAGTSGAAYVFVRNGTVWSQQAYLKPSNTYLNWQFGTTVALDGNTIVVGAPAEGNSATGVNGNQNLGDASISGAAYVFVRIGTNWAQQAYLKASNTDSGDIFGNAVAVQADTIVVGAREELSLATGVNSDQADNTGLHCGAGYVFFRTGTNWAQQAYLKGSMNGLGYRFGNAVAVYGDTIAAAATGDSWSQGGINGTGESGFGSASGIIYVFTRTNSSWSQWFYAKASPPVGAANLGKSLALNDAFLVAGANANSSTNPTGVGAVYVYGDALPEPPVPPEPAPEILSLSYVYDPIYETYSVTLSCVGNTNTYYEALRTDDVTREVSLWDWIGQEDSSASGSFTIIDYAPYPDAGYYRLRKQ